MQKISSMVSLFFNNQIIFTNNMNKTILSFAMLMTAGSIFSACQADGFRIKGEVPTLNNGDTLLLISDIKSNIPSDTLIVKDGKFELEGDADSTRFCMIYSKKDGSNINTTDRMINFFIEPGTIKLKLADKVSDSHVSGTPCNDQWQQMNDAYATIGQEMMKISEKLSLGMSHEEERLEIKKVMELQERFKKIVTEYAVNNADNEFGYFLLTIYDNTDMRTEQEWLIDAGTRTDIIKKMPKKMQQRQDIVRMMDRINKLKTTSEGSIMPDFTMDGIDGKPMSALAEIRKNKVTVIDFWASWCGPCRAEMPNMVKMYDEYKDKGLGILGVSLDSKRGDWEGASKRLGVKWPQMSDLKGWDNAAARMFNIQSIPQTIVVDGNGKILKKGLRGEELEAFVAGLLK